MAQETGSINPLAVQARLTDAIAATNSHLDQDEFGKEVGATTEEIFLCLSRYAIITQPNLDP